LCQKIGIKQVFTFVEHPLAIGQAESAYRVLLRGLRRRLEKDKEDGQRKSQEYCGHITPVSKPQHGKHLSI